MPLSKDARTSLTKKLLFTYLEIEINKGTTTNSENYDNYG
jgi:hypothetical protein